MTGFHKLINKLTGKPPGTPPHPSPEADHESESSATCVREFTLDEGLSAGELYQRIRKASPTLAKDAAPEALCGLTSDMTRDEITSQLAYLYKRYNRTAGSLDQNLANEASLMLDVIVTMRKKYVAN